jgi:16S rRNA (adenine1518-N6/adenine1519-N6)-dimethyltransferase
VRSTFVRITPLAQPLVAAGELARVEALVRRAFARRRKTLANALGAAAPPEQIRRALARVGVPPKARAEELAPATFVALARALRADSAGPS